MSELRLEVMQGDISPSLSCGEKSIDALMGLAYSKTVSKQALAYNILVDEHLVGNCMLKLVRLCDEIADYYISDNEFIALELSYLAIDRRLQGQGIGTLVLKKLIQWARMKSEELPIRFFVLDAFKARKGWYRGVGFGEYPKKMDPRCPGTVAMRMDFINLELASKDIDLPV